MESFTSYRCNGSLAIDAMVISTCLLCTWNVIFSHLWNLTLGTEISKAIALLCLAYFNLSMFCGCMMHSGVSRRPARNVKG